MSATFFLFGLNIHVTLGEEDQMLLPNLNFNWALMGATHKPYCISRPTQGPTTWPLCSFHSALAPWTGSRDSSSHVGHYKELPLQSYPIVFHSGRRTGHNTASAPSSWTTLVSSRCDVLRASSDHGTHQSPLLSAMVSISSGKPTQGVGTTILGEIFRWAGNRRGSVTVIVTH